MADVLENILELRRRSLQKAKDERSLQELEKEAGTKMNKGFLASVSKKGQINIIAEMKKQSPSAGPIRDPYNVEEIAQAYERGGASAVSVLTDPDFFGGAITDVSKVRAACGLPILRKDFVFDPYQIVEARAFGADAVLLIADMLDPKQLKDLVQVANQVNIEPLVEVFTSETLSPAINTGASLIGINSRNLRTLEMVPNNVAALSRLVPHDRFVVAESGLKTPQDMENLKGLPVSAALVGESLLKKANLEDAVRVLVEAGRKS